MEFDYKFKEAVLKIGDNAKYVLPSSVYIMKNKNRKYPILKKVYYQELLH